MIVPFLKFFGELGVGEALLQQGKLVRLEPFCCLVICHVTVLVSSRLWYFLQVLRQLFPLTFYPHEYRHHWTLPEEVKGPDSWLGNAMQPDVGFSHREGVDEGHPNLLACVAPPPVECRGQVLSCPQSRWV